MLCLPGFLPESLPEWGPVFALVFEQERCLPGFDFGLGQRWVLGLMQAVEVEQEVCRQLTTYVRRVREQN